MTFMYMCGKASPVKIQRATSVATVSTLHLVTSTNVPRNGVTFRTVKLAIQRYENDDIRYP